MAYTRKEIKEHFMAEIRMLCPVARREQPISNANLSRFVDADYGLGRREEPSPHYLRKPSSLSCS